jgi:2-polyprenyl-3-methyl-5-hydroxy-6-metoxy-1,4-benzoquinol methylase
MAIDYYSQIKDWMLPMIKDGPNVIMDLGCASGVLGERLIEVGKAKTMYGVEMFESAAQKAAKTYVKVHVGDAEAMKFDYDTIFDYVTCGDILEHLKDPYTMVSNIYKWLKPGGEIFVCLPNVRNYHVLIDLIFRGKWEYVSAGIMDRTHLRFFTRSSLQTLVRGGGFEVCHHHMLVEGPKKTFFNKLTFGAFDEFLAAQTFCRGRKPLK